jgi:hypothetical protein
VVIGLNLCEDGRRYDHNEAGNQDKSYRSIHIPGSAPHLKRWRLTSRRNTFTRRSRKTKAGSGFW